jgi:mannose-1-phosphate guanylyltransferase
MFAVIMAGGSGTRFWPASRERLPKQFLNIVGERSIFEYTLARVRPFIPDENIYAVVSQKHVAMTESLMRGTKAKILAEPIGRNTAAAIGLAAIHIAEHDENQAMAVLPSDHFIANPEVFGSVLQAAGQAALSGSIITLGITPTRPETGYGYLKLGTESGRVSDKPFFVVDKFVEKPNLETAVQYLSSGSYLWNSGMFIFTAKTILAEIDRSMPELSAGLNKIRKSIGSPDYLSVLETVYPELRSISIDFGVMEHAEAPVHVFKGDFGWSDIGSWQALHELRTDSYDEHNNLLMGDVAAVDSDQNLVYSSTGRVVALLGVKGLVIVDTPDALMIADMNRSQDVKKVPEMLKRNGRADKC